MPKILNTEDYLRELRMASCPACKKVLAFYDHRTRAICCDPRMMLVPLDDHLVHRGDGVFETLKYLDGRLYQLDAHIARMQRSCKAIYLKPPCDWNAIAELVPEVIRAGEEHDGLVRILVGRGPGGFGIDPFECPETSLYVVAYRIKVPSEETYEQGVTAFRSSIPAKQSWIAQIKSIDYLPNMLVKREALIKNMDYGFCFDEYGFLAESATENIFLVNQQGVIVVPEFSNSLAGTTLLRCMELVHDHGISVQVRKIQEGELYEARELMIAGTTTDVLSIVRYEGKPIHDARPGPVSKLLRKCLQEDIKKFGMQVF